MTSRRNRQRSPEPAGGGGESEFMPVILPGTTTRVTNTRWCELSGAPRLSQNGTIESAVIAVLSRTRYCTLESARAGIPSMPKKALRISSGALLCSAENALINNFDKIRIARADHPLRIYKAVNVNRDPAAIHEHEVRIPDQPEMSVPESLDEDLLRMPSKTEHFAVTRLELLLVHRRRLIHVRLARARVRTCARLIPVYVRSATLNVRLPTHV